MLTPTLVMPDADPVFKQMLNHLLTALFPLQSENQKGYPFIVLGDKDIIVPSDPVSHKNLGLAA